MHVTDEHSVWVHTTLLGRSQPRTEQHRKRFKFPRLVSSCSSTQHPIGIQLINGTPYECLVIILPSHLPAVFGIAIFRQTQLLMPASLLAQAGCSRFMQFETPVAVLHF